MHTSTTGAATELNACAWLLSEGYQVFRNVSPAGPIDIVAIRAGVVLQLDAKTVETSELTDNQLQLGVLPIYPANNGKFQFRIAFNYYQRRSIRDRMRKLNPPKIEPMYPVYAPPVWRDKPLGKPQWKAPNVWEVPWFQYGRDLAAQLAAADKIACPKNDTC